MGMGVEVGLIETCSDVGVLQQKQKSVCDLDRVSILEAACRVRTR